MSLDNRFCEREPLAYEPEGFRVAGSGFWCCCCIAGSTSREVEIVEAPEGFRPGDFDWGRFGGGSEAVVAEIELAPAAVRNRERGG
jgi:hypothetical protein